MTGQNKDWEKIRTEIHREHDGEFLSVCCKYVLLINKESDLAYDRAKQSQAVKTKLNSGRKEEE